jgi:hypothetical protein
MFLTAGLLTGVGYTIRPECAQIILYGMLWLLVGLFIPRAGINRLKAVCLTLILIIGFLIPAVPYSIIRGEVLPPKLKAVISCNTKLQLEDIRSEDIRNGSNDGEKHIRYMASAIPVDIIKALGKLAQRISENLMYFFMLPLIIGLYYHFRRPREVLTDSKFFIFALITLYIAMMLLLYINFGYISRRHCMPMIVFTAFYIPTGLIIMADWISGITRTGNKNKQKKTQNWFFILLTVGIVICLPKLFKLTGTQKYGYREAAMWLSKNTVPTDIIAVPDKRIAFYAERQQVEYDKNIAEQGNIFEQVNYIVGIVRSEDEKLKISKDTKEEYSTWISKDKKRGKLVIWKVIH